jgi:hypothetical protein
LQQRIVGVIDHHALQSETIVTELPIFIDIRPWGSMSTIVTHGYLTAGRKPPPPIAGGDRCLGCRSRFGWLLDGCAASLSTVLSQSRLNSWC